MASIAPWANKLAILVLCGAIAALAQHNSPAADSTASRSQETIAKGTRFETPLLIQNAVAAGPVVMIVGGIHGDEPAGALAAAQIAAWPIRKGRLIVVPRANPPALAVAKRSSPDAGESLGNLNRNFPTVDGAVKPQGEMAPQLWAVVERFRPDWLLDLHEGFGFRRADAKSVGSSVIHDRSTQAEQMAGQMLQRVNREIADAGKQFVALGPPVAGSLARAVAKHTRGRAMILETTTKTQPLPLRARQHRTMVACFLHSLEMLPETITENSLAASPPAGALHRIAVYQDEGIGGSGVADVTRIWSARPHVEVHPVCGADVRGGVLGAFGVVCFSGGSGSKQSASLGIEGRDAVRQFVRRGGTYVGICGGAYLACSGFAWDLDLLDARTKSDRWQRGQGQVTVEVTPAGQAAFATDRTSWTMTYANGPILAAAGRADLEDFTVLAWFRTEISENGVPAGIMKDSPAIVSGHFGKGRIVCFSPHPEKSPPTQFFISRTLDP